MSPSAAWVSCRSASVAPNICGVLGVRQRLVERAAREAQRRRGDRGAENVERAHGDLEAFAGAAEPAAAGMRQSSKRIVASGCGAITSIRSAIEKPGIVGEDDEGRNAARAGRLAGAGEDGVDVGDAAVGDPGLLAVEDDSRRRPRAPRRSCRDVGAGVRFGQRESGEPFAARDPRQHARCAAPASRRGDRAGAEALHGEGEIGEPVMPGQRLARQAERARIDRGRVAVRRRDGDMRSRPPRRARAPGCGRPRRHRDDRSRRVAPERRSVELRARRRGGRRRRRASRASRASGR